MLQEIQLLQGQQNCVVVTTGYPANIKPTMEKRTIAIAPAPEKNYVTHSTSDLMRCRKKMSFKGNHYTGAQAVSIARRNARERNRVKQVNDGFAALRRHLPASVVTALSNGARRGAGKKLSKVDTLRMVVEYIRYLQQLLDESDASMGITKDPENNENLSMSRNNLELTSSGADDSFLYAASPCSDMAPSPSPSESSSGVSSGYSVPGYPLERYEVPAHHQHLSPMDEDELLDVISWWQQK